MQDDIDMEPLHKLFIYRKKLVKPYIERLLKWMDGITYMMSALFILTLVYEHGFLISFEEMEMINTLYHFVWIVFLVDISLHLLLNYSDTKRKYRGLAWILSLMLYLTLIPVIFHEPEVQGGIHDFWSFFHSRLYHVVLLTLLSLLQLSNGIVRLLGRRTNPSLIFASSFLIFILIGAALLMLPRATYHGISFIDALFTATSAICVTGLVSVDVSSTFTSEGLFIIIMLIQIGGLGVMTLTSFFAMFFMGNTSLYNQLVVRDMVSSQSLSSLLSTLLYILGFTLVIEAAGMGVIFLSIHGTMGMDIEEELAFSAFHSISAFCNAGFSTLYGNLGNELVLHNHNLLYITISFLVILGGIGFPILVNLYETVSYESKRLYHRYVKKNKRTIRKIHLYNLNTRIVLIMTAILLVTGTVAIAVFEWNHAFAGMTATEKWVQGFFNATCPRTAGFSSVGMTTFSVQTLLLMVVLMMIGGGTQSTAGGVKVNVFAVVMLNLRAILIGADKVNIFNRELSHDSIRRSNATLILYLLIVFAGIFGLSILEPQASVMTLVFECTSAPVSYTHLDVYKRQAIRGLALFDLTRFFGYTYLKDNGASLGVPIITSASATADSKPSRNTVAECYDQIIKDLKNAASLMIPTYSWSGTSLNQKDLSLNKKGKISKWATLTLLSRAYLYMGKNSEALQAAEEAIKGSEANKYQLWNTEEYPTVWGTEASEANPGEILFEIVNTTTESPGNESMGYLTSPKGYQDMCITVSFYHHLLETPNDVRIKLLVNQDKKVMYLNKYQPQPGENIMDANIPIVRLSETYLNAAEAAVKNGDATKAAKYLKAIALRGNPDYTMPAKVTLDDVLEERRKELIGEGHRMFDLLRNNLRVTRINETDDMMKEVVHFADEKTSMDFDRNYYRTILPIPQKEINANSNIVQTPEYLK